MCDVLFVSFFLGELGFFFFFLVFLLFFSGERDSGLEMPFTEEKKRCINIKYKIFSCIYVNS